jgi:hypothetical protein
MSCYFKWVEKYEMFALNCPVQPTTGGSKEIITWVLSEQWTGVHRFHSEQTPDMHQSKILLAVNHGLAAIN